METCVAQRIFAIIVSGENVTLYHKKIRKGQTLLSVLPLINIPNSREQFVLVILHSLVDKTPGVKTMFQQRSSFLMGALSVTCDWPGGC